MEWNSLLKQLGVVPNQTITRIVVDSRQAQAGDLFIALNSGWQYMDEALKKGASVVSEKTHPNAFFVKDSIVFLGKLASLHRARLTCKVIGITGSVGKTSLTQFLKQVLAKKGKCVAPINNHNNEIGLPLTLLSADLETQYLVVEMGVLNPGDMSYLNRIVKKLDIAVITCIAVSHLETLLSLKGIFEEKSKIMEIADQVVLHKDSIYWPVSRKACWFGKTGDVRIVDQCVTVGDKTYTYSLDIPHRINTYAAAHAVFQVMGLAVDFTDIRWPKMRLEKRMHSSGAMVIADCYNASMLSYIEAIRYLSKYPNNVLVMGEITELGERADSVHAMLGRVLNHFNIEKIVVYGKRHYLSTVCSFLGEAIVFDSKKEIKKWLDDHLKKDMHVLVKGARFWKMEEVL